MGSAGFFTGAFGMASFRPEYAVWTSQAELRFCLPDNVPNFSTNAPPEILLGVPGRRPLDDKASPTADIFLTDDSATM
jgi:hypothetical protein